MDEQRPDPDALLERVQQAEEKSRRGKLKIFFGACAGVGKTFAMLTAAQQQRLQGRDVVVGIVETHGRKETQAVLEGLETIPLKTIEYREKHLQEFDLDTALERRPALILIDELAHTNAPGSRHPKRWQDVEELLASGRDVYSTMNVQHLESLNDIVGSITGIRVWETVPDTVFSQADEVVLVDIVPDELLQRLHEGKIYLPHQAKAAIKHFFRKGNLIALRELALRRTADRVDEQMRSYREERAIAGVWQTKENILVCVGPKPGAEKIIRGASRLATELGVEWHAVYVETPKLQRLANADRERILHSLRLAQELGAQTATLGGGDAATALVDYAHSRNLPKLVVGCDSGEKSVWFKPWPWHRSFATRLVQLSGDLDIILIVRDVPNARGTTSPPRPNGRISSRISSTKITWAPYGWTIAACSLTTGIGSLMAPYFEPVNIVMVFLMTVVFSSVRFGRGPAVLAAFLSVLLFDFFFVPPRLSFAVSDVQYLVTFAVMLTVALIIGQLTANFRYQAQVASQREKRLRALYEMARDLSGALLPEQIVALSHHYVEHAFGVKIALLLVDHQDRLMPPIVKEGEEFTLAVDLSIAQWSYESGLPSGFGTDTLPASPILYLPLSAPMRTRGVLAVQPTNPRWLLIPEQRRQLNAFAALIATALERVHYIEVAQDTLIKMESERLRSSVLSALSHDLRTPLTSMVGLADALNRTPPKLSPAQQSLVDTIQDQAFRMSALVNNLLDMARLRSGTIRLNLQWQPLEEVVGSALKIEAHQLAAHHVLTELPPDLPLLAFDAVLIERVLCNLLENAAKYTPIGSTIILSAAVQDQEVRIALSDNGPGVPTGTEEAIFEKFSRGKQTAAMPGVGLGLAISRAIVNAHKGRIWVENLPDGGARFIFSLPLGVPPALTDLPKEELPSQ
ncbi:MAG: two-component system sensor histidine kinase KdpD [Halothiobacillus sp.]